MSLKSSEQASPSRGYCPFRISPSKSQINCVLQLGDDSPCYCRDVRPLLRRDSSYMCPLVTKLAISPKKQEELSQFVSRLLVSQEEKEPIVFNLWSFLGGTIDPDDPDFETPPFPYLYYFPYPKGPPAASTEALPKLVTCPSCLKTCEVDVKFCPICGHRLLSD